MSELEQLKQAISALEAQRTVLGEEVVNTALAPLREKLAALQPENARQQALGEQRKLVTILFSDLAGFTAMSEKMDPEDVREILNDYFARWTAAIEQFGGMVEKFIGDAVMSAFGLPAAHEDDPEKAILAALAMRASLEELNQKLKRAAGMELAMRVGIHTGPVVVSFLGERKGQDFVVVGDTVNLASRLQSVAPVNGILISHDTYRHVRGIFDVQSREPIPIKGKSKPVQTYLVQRAKPRTFHMPARGVEGIETHMIGREAELKRLQESLYAAIENQERQVVTVVGEAGIGKSRLIAEFSGWLELIPDQVIYFKARAAHSMQNQPNSLLRSLFAFRFQIHDSDPTQVVWEKMEQGISVSIEMSHFIGQLLGFDFHASPYLKNLLKSFDAGHQSLDARQVHDRALVFLNSYFRVLLNQAPVVLLLEDIHWADDSSLDILEYLAGSLAQHRLLIVCAARSTLFERRPLWAAKLSYHTRLDLQPLSRYDSRRLVEEILQKLDKVPVKLRELIVSNAEGNPFYVEELIKMLIEDEVIQKGEEHWVVDLSRIAGVRVPPTLAGVLQARFDSLSHPEKILLQRASVIGRIFWDDAVKFLGQKQAGKNSGSPEPEVLKRLASREMVYQHEVSAFKRAREYLFKHALLRDVTYESILKRERRIYHAYAARWLEQVTERSQRSNEYAALIAEHYDIAGEAQIAARWYRQAGQHAASRYANAEAARLFSHALELTPEESQAEQYTLLREREKIFCLQGDRQAQVKDQDSMEALAEKLADNSLRAEVALLRASLAEATGDYNSAISYAQLCVGLAKSAENEEIEANGILVWGSGHYRLAENEEAHLRFEQALTQARQLHKPGLEADILRSLGILSEVQGDYNGAREYLEHSLILYRETNDRRGESMSLNSLGAVALHQVDYPLAWEYFDRALRLKREIGDRYAEGITLNDLGIVAFHQGEHALSQNYFEQCLQICREISDREGESAALNGLGTLAFYIGNYSQAKEYNRQALAICQEIGDRQGESGAIAFFALIAIDESDYPAALRYSQQAAAISEEANSLYELGYALTYLGHALLGIQHLEEAARAYQKAHHIRQENGQLELALDDLAGLARVSLAQEDYIQAAGYVDDALNHENGSRLAQAEEPIRVYLTCYRVLQIVGDERALAILQSAYTLLKERLAKIKDEAARLSFLENIPVNRELLSELMEQGILDHDSQVENISGWQSR